MTIKNNDVSFLGIEGILLEEYRFYSSYFLQIAQDRTGTYNFYIVVVGVLASSLGFLYQFGSSLRLPQSQAIAIILFLIGGLNFSVFCRLTIFSNTQGNCIAKMREIMGLYAQHYKDQVLNIEAVLYLKTISTSKAPSGIFSVSINAFLFGTLTGVFLCMATFIEGELLIGNSSIFPLVTNAIPYIVGLSVGIITFLLLIPMYKLLHYYSHKKMSFWR